MIKYFYFKNNNFKLIKYKLCIYFYENKTKLIYIYNEFIFLD
jgi:hypothetical protein